MPGIASLEDLKVGQKEGLVRYALGCMKMAQDWLEEYL